MLHNLKREKIAVFQKIRTAVVQFLPQKVEEKHDKTVTNELQNINIS